MILLNIQGHKQFSQVYKAHIYAESRHNRRSEEATTCYTFYTFITHDYHPTATDRYDKLTFVCISHPFSEELREHLRRISACIAQSLCTVQLDVINNEYKTLNSKGH